MNTSEAAHKPSDLEAKFHGEARTADGYQYWTTSQEDEEALSIRDQVEAGTYESPSAKQPRRKLLPPGTIRRTGVRIASLILVAVLAVIGYFAFSYVQVSNASGENNTRQADVAIVLGPAQAGSAPSYELQERLDHAVNLYNDQTVRHIFVTTADDRATGLSHLLERGVPEEAITEIPEGTNSWDQLAASAEAIQKQQLDTALLISDRHHNYRLQAIADEMGLEAFVSPSAVPSTVVNKLTEAAAVALGRVTGYETLTAFSES